MPRYSKIQRLRKSAYSAQSGRCYYCQRLMWEKDQAFFAHTYQLTAAQVHLRKSTAEHLLARKDGGKDSLSNIVAACLWCNTKRHARKRELSPQDYKTLVSRCISLGRWHNAR